MSTDRFRIQEHSIPGSHIRGYPRATADDQEDVLKIVIKQYTPKDSSTPDEGDVTIIAAHANGFPKVCFAQDELPKHTDVLGTLRATLG